MISENNKLKKLDLTGLNDRDTWAKVLERIKTLLKDKFETKFKKTIDEGLEIELQDEKGDKLAKNTPITANFKIILSLKGSNLDKIILNHEIEIAPSPETLWNEFINSISSTGKLNDLSLTDFTNKNKWDDVLKAIREKLVKEFNKVFGNETDLLIELQDEKNQILDPKTDIGLDYLKDNKRIKIVLSYGKNKSLNNSFVIGFKVLSPLSKFIKSLVDKTTWDETFYDRDGLEKVEDKLASLLKDHPNIDYTITSEPNWKEFGAKKITIEFFDKTNSKHKEAKEFNFTITESPLSKFIKSLVDKTTWDETFYDRDGLEKVEDKLASLLKDHPNIDYTITSEPNWKEFGAKKITIEFFDKTNSKHKEAKEFNFTITESPLSKFIKSLVDKTTWDETFYDRDGLEKVEDKLASLLKGHPDIDYTITSEPKWELGKKKITIEFFDKTNSKHKEAKEFNFTITESPLSKFIKSLTKTTWDETFYDRDGLEKVEDKLASLLKDHPNIDYTITSEPNWKEFGAKKITIEFFDKTNSKHKEAKEFNFTITESPLSKFIKSLTKTTWDETFYDRDGLEKVEDKLASLLKDHPNIDYTITSEPNWKEFGAKKITIEFFDKTNSKHKEAKEFNFTITESPLSKFIKSLVDKTTWDETFYDRDGLEKVEDKLASLLKGHPDIDYTITSEPNWKEFGAKKITIEFFDKTNSKHKEAKEFNFTITESPLSKFIKSLTKTTWDETFYDRDGLEKVEDKLASLLKDHPNIDYTITSEPNWKEFGAKKITIEFFDKTNSKHKEAKEFNFTITESPLSKFIKSLTKTTWDETFYDRDGLEKVEDKLASLLKDHPNIDYTITSEPNWKEFGAKKITIEFFDKTNSKHKEAKEFNFTITESPLSKFIKSLTKTTWDETFYDRDGLEKVEDKLASLLKDHPNIDYTITSEPNWKEFGAKKITIEFFDKTNSKHKEAKEFNFTITESPLSKFIKSLTKTTWDETFYDRDGLEKVEDKLASLLKGHPDIDYTITSEPKWELGKKKITIEFFDKTNSKHKEAKEFNFTITESPLSKFIKSLTKTTWDETFYDRDGLEKVEDKLASLLKDHPNIDYTITSEPNWKEFGAKKITIEFFDKTNSKHKEAKEFNFTITESPLSKFIKSLVDKTTWDETFYDRDGLEKVEDKLASLLKGHPDIDYTITSEPKWELGKKKITIEFFDKTNSKHKEAKEFNFTITESPLSKFIKSLTKTTWDETFYDRDGLEKVEDKLASLLKDHPNIDYTITSEPNWKEFGAKKITIEFFDKTNSKHKEAKEFNFTITESPLSKFIKSLVDKTTWDETFYDRDGLEKVEDKLASLLKGHPDIDYTITSEPKWELGKKKITIEFFDKTNSKHKEAKEFNFTITESPLSKFIKSLTKTTWDETFYDRDGLEKVEDKLASLLKDHPNIDYTITSEPNWKEFGAKKITIEFFDKTNSKHKEAKEFNFTITESPLSKFIKSLVDKTTWDETFYDRDGLEKVEDKLASLLKGHPDIDYTITSEPNWKEFGAKKITIEFFDKTNSKHKEAKEFNFTITESPLSKFIKSLTKTTWDETFYDRDGLEKVEDKLASLLKDHPNIDYTITSEPNWKEFGAKKITIEFFDKTNSKHKEAKEFNFTITESPLSKFIKSLTKTTWDETFYDRDGLEKVEDKLASLLKDHPNIDYTITSEPNWKEFGAKKITIEFFDKTNSKHKEAKEFNFTITESPLSKFIKSLTKTTWDETFYDRDGLEKVEDKLASLLKGHPDIDYTITSEPKWELGKKKITIEFFDKTNSKHKEAKEFNFTITESPLSKFIKSLTKTTWDETFYDRDGLEKVEDKLASLLKDHPNIDYTITSEPNWKEFGAKKITIEFFDKTNSKHKEAKEFNFTITESPLSKFIKSLVDKTTWDETFYDRDGLEKVEDKLASLLKGHPDIDYTITSEPKWELGKKKITIEFFDKTNSKHKEAKEFNFTITESPLSKFIKSLTKTTWDETFYDRDGLEKVEDKLASLLKDHPNIDYTITSEPNWKEFGAKKITIEFFDKTNSKHKEAKEFNFTITESPLSKFIKSLVDKTTWDETFYDRDGLEKVEDKLASLLKGHPDIDYTITSEPKWELGKKKITIEFFDKTNSKHKEAKEFNFTITESPLSKFIKSLTKTTWDETFYDRDGLEKVEDKLASLLKDHPNIDYTITSEPNWKEFGAKKITIEFFDKTNSKHKEAKEFNFTITESPLSKFIKSLVDKTTWDETFYDRDGLEKVEDKLASLLKGHPDIDYTITSEPNWKEFGAKKITIEFFDKTNSKHKEAKEFNFTITESPLSKFIKSLTKTTWDETFYDRDGLEKVEDKLASLLKDHPNIDYTITSEPNWKEFGAKKITIEFFDKTNSKHKEAKEFNFTITESPLSKFIKSLVDKTTWDETFYDRDGLEKVEDKLASLLKGHPDIDYTITSEPKWELGKKKITIEFFDKTNSKHKEAKEFNFTITESPLSKFIKSLTKTTWDETFYDRDGLEKVEDKLASLLKDHPNIDYTITSEPNWKEFGAKKITIEFFDKTNSKHKEAKEFNFTITESPLSKFIKSLVDKTTWDETFYDRDGLEKVEDKLASLLKGHPDIDYTITSEPKWELGKKKITIEFFDKTNSKHKEAKEFNFTITESPLSKFIKSLTKTTWDETFYDRDGLEKVEDKLASLLKGHPDIDYTITSEPKWELGKKKITIEFFDKTNSKHKEAKEFNFTITESPLSKFIKSLVDKNLHNFNDFDNFSTIEDLIQKIIDSSIFKDFITFEPIDKSKNLKVGNNQTLKVKLKQKNTLYEEEVEFKYNVILSQFTQYLNRINESIIGEITYKHNYKKNTNKFIDDYKKLINDFFEKNKLPDGQILDYEILTKDFDFESGTKNIEIKITYQGVIRNVTLKLVLKKINLSYCEVKDLTIDHPINPNYDETAFEKSSINKREIIEKVIKALKDKVKDFNNIDIDEYMNYFDFKNYDNIYADFDNRTYNLDFISTLNKFVEGKIEVKLNVKKNSVRLNDLAKIFLEQLKKNDPELFKLEINNDYKFYFDSDGLKDFARLKAKYEELITKRINEILYDDKYWLGKILKEQKIIDKFEFDNFDISDSYEFSNTNFNMTMKYRGKNQANKFTFKDTRIANLLKFEINTNEVKVETAKKFLDDLDKHKQTHKLTEGMMKDDKKWIDENYSVTGLMNDDIDDWINIKKFIDNGFATNTIIKRKNLLNDYGFEWSRELSNTKNGYFYYSPNRNLVLNVKVNKYNNKGNYKDEPNEWSFSTGEISVKLYALTNKSKLNGSWLPTEEKYDLINRVEWEWYAKFRSALDNGNGHKNSLNFGEDKSWYYVIHRWLVHDMTYWIKPKKWTSVLRPNNIKPPEFSHFEDDHMVIKFGLVGKPEKSKNKDGFSYTLKLGGSGHIKKLRENHPNLFDDKYNFWDSLKKANLEKVDLKFRLYRTNDPHKTSEDTLLPIGKDVNYILA